MLLFLISFHDIDVGLGVCIVRASSEEEALAKVNKAGFPRQVGLPDHGRVLVTEMFPKVAALVPEQFVDRLITDDEFVRVYKLLQPAGSIPEGPVLEATADHMTARINEDMARDLRRMK